MKTNNIIQDKSFDFAVRIVNLYKYMITESEFESLFIVKKKSAKY